MSPKFKNILRKGIYLILFLAMGCAFVYLSEKYADNSEKKIYTITDYYPNNQNKYYEVVTGNKIISLLRSGRHIILIGNSKSSYSQKYVEELDRIFNKIKIDKVYYYDLNNDKSQKNSNYYKILELLDGNLVTTDGGDNNLLAPSLYIVDNGKVMYYNTDTVAIKNTEDINTFWTDEQESIFESKIIYSIYEYYEKKVYTITDYYPNNQNKYYEVVNGDKMISLLKKGKNLIVIGNGNSPYSEKYIEELDNIFNELKINKVYYYDLDYDKTQKNTNYYKILELLGGSLVTTESGDNNLLAPSFYIVNNGKVMYYNADTVAIKNTEDTDSYWTHSQEIIFANEITNNINKYYLNK